jgi:hypothetical protein
VTLTLGNRVKLVAVVCVSNLPVFSVSDPTRRARFKPYKVEQWIRLALYCVLGAQRVD